LNFIYLKIVVFFLLFFKKFCTNVIFHGSIFRYPNCFAFSSVRISPIMSSVFKSNIPVGSVPKTKQFVTSLVIIHNLYERHHQTIRRHDTRQNSKAKYCLFTPLIILFTKLQNIIDSGRLLQKLIFFYKTLPIIGINRSVKCVHYIATRIWFS